MSGAVSVRHLDDDCALAAMEDAMARLDAIEAQRRALSIEIGVLCHRARVGLATYYRAVNGLTLPRSATLDRLERALETPPEPPADQARRLFRVAVVLAAAQMGIDPQAALDADPHANARGGREAWLMAMQARAVAVYALVVGHDLSMTEVGKAAGVSKQAVWKSLRVWEEKREDAGVDAMLDRIAALIGGVK